MGTLEQSLLKTYDWAIDRIHYLSKEDYKNAMSIQEEFNEWIDPFSENHDIYSLEYIGEKNDWT